MTLCTSCSSSNASSVEPIDKPVASNKLLGSFESQYKRYTKGEKFVGQSNNNKILTQWSDTVWRNDRVHKQILLWTTSEEMTDLSYEVSDLKYGSNVITASNIQIRFPSYILGDIKSLKCGEQTSRSQTYIADALSENIVNRVLSTEPTKIWLTVDIPSTTAPGLYMGSFSVMKNGTTLLSLEIKLLVVNHTLPNVKDWTYNLDIWQFPFQLANMCTKNGSAVVPFSSNYYNMMTPFYKKLFDSGQKSITTYIKSGAFNKGESMVKWILNSDNTWSFDYSDFDTYIDFMFSLGIDKQINCFSLAGWNKSIGYYDQATNTLKVKDLVAGTVDYNTIWSIFLQSFKSHLKSKGWFDKAVLYLDETRNDEAKLIISLIRTNGIDWKIGIAGSELDESVEKELYDYSTIIGYNRHSSNNIINSFYTSCSQTHPNNYVSQDESPAEMVWMAWYAANKGYNGYTRWAYDYWQSSDIDNIQDATNTAGDFSFIYRTTNTIQSKPVSSIRLELLREGVQDYEKIKILSNAQLQSYVKSVTFDTAIFAESIINKVQKALKNFSIQ